MDGRRHCLVIGPYGSPGTETRRWSDWIRRDIVQRVADEFGYSAIRTIDDPMPGQITTRVMGDLQRADLVVADLTDENPNVYYELALRHATAKPFIHLAKEGTKIPFDLTVMDVIFVSEGKDAEVREKLGKQIRAIERGEVDFDSASPWPRPQRYVRGYVWEVTYSNQLASAWLEQQEQGIRDAVRQFMSSAGGAPPASQQTKNKLLEYLMYKSATSLKVDLFYVIDRK